MALKAKIIQNTNMIARVTTSGDSLAASKPVTLKNQINEIRSIEDFGDVELWSDRDEELWRYAQEHSANRN